MYYHPSARPEADSTSPLVSVIIPAYYAAARLELCLDAVAAADYRNFEVLAVFDRPTDQAVEVAASRGARVIENDNRRGPPTRATSKPPARAAKSTFLSTRIASSIATRFRSRYPPSGRAIRPSSAPIGPKLARRGSAAGSRTTSTLFTHQNAAPLQTSFQSGRGAIPRQAFGAAGGFDMNPRDLEDVEFGYEISRGGYPIKLVKNMRAERLKAYSFPRQIESGRFARAIP